MDINIYLTVEAQERVLMAYLSVAKTDEMWEKLNEAFSQGYTLTAPVAALISLRAKANTVPLEHLCTSIINFSPQALELLCENCCRKAIWKKSVDIFSKSKYSGMGYNVAMYLDAEKTLWYMKNKGLSIDWHWAFKQNPKAARDFVLKLKDDNLWNELRKEGINIDVTVQPPVNTDAYE